MTNPRLIALALFLCAGPSVGCGDEPPPPLVNCSQVTPKKYSELTIFGLCNACHSSALSGAARMNAPVGSNFDSFEGAKAKAGLAASRVNLGQMPPAGSPRPTEEQKADLIAWATCGTPQ
jgi:uncharacterized membrane protein